MAQLALAQAPTGTEPALPRLVRFGGTVRDPNGGPLAGVVGVTFALYSEQTGGAPLWLETQNATADSSGHYTALLGATKPEGLPVELFTGEQARWVGVQVEGQAEQPRVLLVSVPYALKADDADTLGGRPASAYLLADPSTSAQPAGPSGATQPAQPEAAVPVKTAAGVRPSVTGSNYIPVFTNTTGTLGDSVMFQNGSNIGVGTTAAAISMDIRPTATSPFAQLGVAQTVDYMTLFASDTYGPAFVWDPAKALRFGAGGPGLYNPYIFSERMRIQPNGYVGIGTEAPAAPLEVNGNAQVDGNLALGGSLWSPGGVGGPGPIFQAGNNGVANVSAGLKSLQPTTTGGYDTAVGYNALASTTGTQDTAVGYNALGANTVGSYNTALGSDALMSNVGGNQNIAVGQFAGAYIVGNNNIDIGNNGADTDSGVIRIGTAGPQAYTYIAGIYGNYTSVNNAVEVMIDSNGNLGTTSSSRRYKEDIQDMADASSGLLRLRPVTFRYKKPYSDGSQPIQYGLIAEEVADVYPDLVARSADGQIETVKYQVLGPMLLNELQKQNTTITVQNEQIQAQEQVARAQAQQIRSLEERLATMEAALQRISVSAPPR
jgi:hypothetical protein